MRINISIILITALVTGLLPAQQAQADSPIKQEIAALPSSSLVEVSVRGGGILRGHIARRTETDFSLRPEKGSGTQTIAYDQVLSVSQVKVGHSHKKWIIIGVVAGAIVVVAIIAAKIASNPLGGSRIGF
jgi:hypothetical protein